MAMAKRKSFLTQPTSMGKVDEEEIREGSSLFLFLFSFPPPREAFGA